MRDLTRPFRLSPAKFAIGYLVFGTIWIFFSDRLLARLVESPTQVTQLQTLKGWAFVAVSASLVYALASVRERQIALTTNQLQRVSQELQVLHRIFRHNISNDITVIRGYIGVALDRATDSNVKDHLSTALQKADEVIDMSEKLQIVAVTDFESTIHSSTDLIEIVERECLDFEWDRFAATLETDLPETARVRGDEIICYAVREALDNAISHFDRDPAECRISITVEKGIVETVVTISDNGPGIPEPELETINRGDETQTLHSSGVGLWLISWICSLCGGEAELRVEDGTEVVMRFVTDNKLRQLDPSRVLGSEQVPGP